ncbi:MAG: hypothetical protein LBR19_02395, partial [Bifidobacteriaceae bacterium]|nr:hypothetical protein [Bifidobacteriaceae bacterium]
MSESSLSPAPAGPEGPADLADPLSASTPPAVLPQPQGRVYGPWWQQAGAWIVIGAVVVVCATALVLGIGLSGRSSNQAAPVVFETVTVTPTKQDSAA